MKEHEKFYLTKQGLEDLKKEYAVLKSLRATKTKGEAPSLWESEDVNPEYISYREDLNFLENRIAELEDILEKVCLIKHPGKKDLTIVSLGATVAVQVHGQKDKFTIVGTLEANPALGKISDESPVGRAFLGHQVGDKIVVPLPIKTIYKIEKIKYN